MNRRATWLEAVDAQLRHYLWLTNGTTGKPRFVHPDGSYDPPDEDSDRHQQIETSKLFNADPIFITAEICDLITVAAETFRPQPLIETDFLTKMGFLWFEKRLQDRVNGFAWSLMKWPAEAAAPYSAHFSFYGPDIATAIEQSLGSIPVDGEDQLRLDGMTLMRAAQTTLALMREFRAASRYRERPDRPTRKSVRRAGLPERDVLVVRLRRERSLGERVGDHIDYAYRFMVSGHWRDQWYPSAQTHRQVWISPYVKGPDDKPFRPPSKRIFNFDR